MKGKIMRVRIEIEPELPEDEVIIRCRKVEEHILKLQQMAVDSGPGDSCIALQSGDTKYYVPLAQLLFFETEGKLVQAHTADRLYLTDRKLYNNFGKHRLFWPFHKIQQCWKRSGFLLWNKCDPDLQSWILISA